MHVGTQGREYTNTVVEGARIYREEGKSGKDTNRPEFKRLLADIRSGRIRLLVFTELSRISRSVSDFLRLSDFLEAHRVQFVSLRENFDTTSPHGRLIMIVLMALNQFERETTALRTKLAMRDRAEKGLFNGGSLPLGYDPNPKHKGQLVVVEEEAMIIREAFKNYLECGSIAKTARILKDRGYRRRSRKSKRGHHNPGGPVAWTTVAHILQNPSYIGLKEVNRAMKKLPPEEVLALDEVDRYRLVPAQWEPIIDVDLFERAQEMLVGEHRARTANTIAPKDYDYVLQGIVRCAACGTVLEGGSSKKQQYHYYRHPQGTRSEGCDQAGWQAEVLEEAVLSRLSKLADDEALLEQVIQKANDRIVDEVPAKAREVAAAEQRLADLQAKHNDLVERLMEAPKDAVPASFWTKAQEMEADVDAARGEVSRLKLELEEVSRSRLCPKDYRDALVKMREVYKHLDPLQRSNLLAYVLDRVEVKGSEMTIALLGQVPETGRFEVLNAKGGKYLPPSTWLRILAYTPTQNPENILGCNRDLWV